MKGCGWMIDQYDNERCDSNCPHADAVERVLHHMPPEDELLDLAELFKVFGDTTRIKIQAKLIKNRRDGKTVYYSLADDHVKTIIGMAKEHLEE